MKALEWTSGVTLALAGAVTVLLGIGFAHPLDREVLGEDVSVFVLGDRPYLLEPRHLRSPLGARVGPREARARLIDRGDLGHDAVGLFLRTWSVEYAKRWRQEVAVPVVRGPLLPANAPLCGIELHLGLDLLDTRVSPALGQRFVQLAQRRIDDLNRRVSVEQGLDFRFPPVAAVRIEPSVSSGVINVRAAIVFDALREIRIHAEVLPRAEDGRLSLSLRRAAEVSFSPALREQFVRSVEDEHPFLCLLGCGSHVDAGVASDGAATVSGLAAELSKTLGAHHEITSPLRASDRVRFTLASAPDVQAGGLKLTGCAALLLSQPLVDPTLTGIPELRLPGPRLGPVRRDRLAVGASHDVLNRLLFLSWQSGWLREKGRSPEILDQLPADVAKLAFRVDGLEPRLPPFVAPADGALTVSLLGVHVGAWNGRDVVGHGVLQLDASAARSRLEVTARPRAAFADCQAREAGGTRFTSCLADLLPVVRERIADGKVERAWDLDGLRKALSGFGPELVELGGHLGSDGVALHARVGVK